VIVAKTLTVTASEANRSFSRLLRQVREGATVQITSHGQRVAELRPPDAGDADERRNALFAHLDELAARDFVVIEPWTRAELYERD
jgi:prevent-host-death family protein